MSVKIIVDSTADFSLAECEALGLLRAPLTVHWDGVEYRDGIDMTPPEFFERLTQSASLPTTSQVPVPAFEQLFREVLDNGDEAVAVLISHNLSGTYQSATIALDGLSGGGAIHLVDGGTGSLGTMLLVRYAITLRDGGSSAADIAAEINRVKGDLHIYAAVETLKFLQKGGRLSMGAAVLGTLLSVKPVLMVTDGKISVPQKVRGNNAAHQWIAKQLALEGFNKALPPIIGTTQCPELLEQFTDAVRSASGYSCTRFCDIGTVIGTHTGPGTVAIAFISSGNHVK